FDFDLTSELLAKVEAVEAVALRALACPTDPVALFDLVSKKVPWPQTMSADGKRRVERAMFTLSYIPQTRNHLRLGSEDAQAAARDALLAGLYAGEGALQEALRATRQLRAKQAGKAPKKRRTQIAMSVHDAIRAAADELPRRLSNVAKA